MNNSSYNTNWKLEGTVWYVGLQCPPESKFSVPPCTGPYPDYEFIIKSSDGKNAYIVKTDSQGKFEIFLEPQSYIVVAQNTIKYNFTIQKDSQHPPINILINSDLE
jgi:hypothetical protein